MLHTDDRALLVDLLTPPEEGYRLERAAGTTYTLQLEALVRIPLAVAGLELGESTDPLGVMEAVRSSADRIDVFCQVGMLSVPSLPNPLLAFLEPMVHQVGRPQAGKLFHPKIWLASFTHPAGPRRFRFLCTSRNLTGDHAWDAVVGLDGVTARSERPLNRPLADFIAALPGRASHALSAQRAAGVASLAEQVCFAEWEPPEAMAEDRWLRFHWLGDGRRTTLDFSGARRLVISPFLSAEGLEVVWPGGECTIVSRPESFAALGSEYLAALAAVGAELYELDDSAALPDEDDADSDVRWALRGLHAKVVVMERDRRAHVVIGSPNATANAWAGNTEFAVELVGNLKRYGVRATLAEDEGGFKSVLRPFSDRPEPAPPETTLQLLLERALIDVAALRFETEALAIDDVTWTQRIRSVEALPATFPEGATLRLRLLTRNEWHDQSGGERADAAVTGLDPEDVTPFVVIELVAGSPSSPVTAGCVVLAALSGAPPDRLDRLIARSVGSPEAFLRFVMLLLQLGRGDTTQAVALMGGAGRGRWSFLNASTEGLLEPLMHALVDHPESIEEINRLVSRLSATDTGLDVLPDGWDLLWPEVLDARRRLAARP